MIGASGLAVVLAVQLVAVLLVLGVYVMQAVVKYRLQGLRSGVDRTREAVLRCLSSGREQRDAVRRLRLLPMSIRMQILRELGVAVAGPDRGLLVGIAARSQVLGHARALLVRGAWRDRLAGVGLLSSLGVSDERMPALLLDPAPTVRAAAVLWSAGCDPQDREVEALLDRLEDPSRAVRFATRIAVSRVGQAVVQPLRARIGSRPGLSLVDVLSLGIPDPRFDELAVAAATDPRSAVRRAAAEVLGSVASVEARARLRDLVDDPEPAVRLAAVRGLGGVGDMENVRVLSRVARHDPDGLVRAAGVHALSMLGPAGRLALLTWGEPVGGRGSGSGP